MGWTGCGSFNNTFLPTSQHFTTTADLPFSQASNWHFIRHIHAPCHEIRRAKPNPNPRKLLNCRASKTKTRCRQQSDRVRPRSPSTSTPQQTPTSAEIPSDRRQVRNNGQMATASPNSPRSLSFAVQHRLFLQQYHRVTRSRLHISPASRTSTRRIA